MRSYIGYGVLAFMAVAVLAMMGGTQSQPGQPAQPQPPQTRPQPGPDGITMMRAPFEFPAIGNIDAVRQWRLGRIERLERRAGMDDVLVDVRTPDGRVQQVIMPLEPVGILVRRCGWLSTPTQTFASRSDYVERMIAFDVDRDGRIIALMSLEPFGRNQSRLRRAFCD